MPTRTVIRIALLAAASAVAACQEMDPYSRTGMWQPTGANAGNLAAMAANPYDLIRGRSVERADAKSSGMAVDRVWLDRPKVLLDPGASGGSGGGASGGGGGGASSGSGG